MFRRVLIANRGEIAVRLARGLRELGVESVAVYSEADAGALHVRTADRALPLRGLPAAESYLDADQLLAAARAAGAEAIHPGYGFLSENAAFAAAVARAGLAWIGPPSAAIAAMGDKVAARARMTAAGVPVVPGWSGGPGEPEELAAGAAAVGYPLLVKAAAGGGGKGMRAVERPEELAAAAESCRREAEKSFGDGTIFLERLLRRPRHVEVQILADSHGSVLHLNERECSIQRRHQKIVEESPSPALDPTLRERMGAAAVAAARAVGYVNAGTVEFLLDASGEFYFLEMNTRLQVEHPVTELVTGRDLVHAQLRVAAGEPLCFRQEDVAPRGHALECRIYAEDPAAGFLPSTGTLRVYREPGGPGVRVDSGVREGSEVSVLYDPLLAKLVTWGEDRATAIARMQRALGEYVVLGVTTNIPFLRALLRHPAFLAGHLHTGFLAEHGVAAPSPAPGLEVLAAAALALGRREPRAPGRAAPTASPWRNGGAWRAGAACEAGHRQGS